MISFSAKVLMFSKGLRGKIFKQQPSKLNQVQTCLLFYLELKRAKSNSPFTSANGTVAICLHFFINTYKNYKKKNLQIEN